MKKFDLPSKLQVTVRVIGVVLGAEFLVRALYNSLAFELSTFQASTLNAFALVVISTPIIYFWVVKPYVSAYQNALNQIEYISCLDPLTKLANRRLISVHVGKTLANAQRHGLHGALMVMDLDGFKPINDRHGHEAGDAVLVEISQRLQAIVRTEDIVGRLGGDEFVVVLSNLGRQSDEALARSKFVAKRLLDTVVKPVEYNGETLSVSASIGIRFIDLDPNITADTLINEADAAMYQAKKAGKARAVIFQKQILLPEMHTTTS